MRASAALHQGPGQADTAAERTGNCSPGRRAGRSPRHRDSACDRLQSSSTRSRQCEWPLDGRSACACSRHGSGDHVLTQLCSDPRDATRNTPHPSDSERQAGSGLSFRVWKPADSMKREPRRLGAAVPSHVARLSSQALGPCLAPNAGSSGGFPSKRPWAPKTPPRRGLCEHC